MRLVVILRAVPTATALDTLPHVLATLTVH